MKEYDIEKIVQLLDNTESSTDELILALANTTSLDLSNCNITPHGAITLASALRCNTRITDLNLSYNTIGSEGAKAIADSLPSTSITRLNLSSNGIEDEGAQAIAQSLPSTSILSLELRNNAIRGGGAQAIAHSLPSTSIFLLDLSSNAIGSEGAKAIAHSLPSTNISLLELSGNAIRDTGAKAIAQSLPSTSILSLDLSHNAIEDEGAKAIAQSLPSTSIFSLDLSHNAIEDASATSITENIAQSCERNKQRNDTLIAALDAAKTLAPIIIAEETFSADIWLHILRQLLSEQDQHLTYRVYKYALNKTVLDYICFHDLSHSGAEQAVQSKMYFFQYILSKIDVTSDMAREKLLLAIKSKKWPIVENLIRDKVPCFHKERDNSALYILTLEISNFLQVKKLGHLLPVEEFDFKSMVYLLQLMYQLILAQQDSLSVENKVLCLYNLSNACFSFSRLANLNADAISLREDLTELIYNLIPSEGVDSFCKEIASSPAGGTECLYYLASSFKLIVDAKLSNHHLLYSLKNIIKLLICKYNVSRAFSTCSSDNYFHPMTIYNLISDIPTPYQSVFLNKVESQLYHALKNNHGLLYVLMNCQNAPEDKRIRLDTTLDNDAATSEKKDAIKVLRKLVPWIEARLDAPFLPLLQEELFATHSLLDQDSGSPYQDSFDFTENERQQLNRLYCSLSEIQKKLLRSSTVKSDDPTSRNQWMKEKGTGLIGMGYFASASSSAAPGPNMSIRRSALTSLPSVT